MASVWQASIREKYEDNIALLETALRECPEDLWGASVWQVRLSDRHVWPIVSGVGAELPEEQRLHLRSAFWVVAYHVLFYLDFYLDGGVGEPSPPAPFRADEQRPHTLPHRVYSREELIGYLEHCRRKAASILGGLTGAEAERPARRGRPFADMLLHNLLELKEHVVHLQLLLNREAAWSDSRWTTSDRWFQPCPDCAGGPR